MIIIGLTLIPIYLLLIFRLKSLDLKKITRICLNIILLGGAFIYVELCFVLKMEPFNFNIINACDYILYTPIIFIFSPFLWMVLYYYCRKLFKNIRLHKNSKLKTKKEYIYYRDDLNKISPSIIMFTSLMDVDMKKCISSTILKLKLTGYIKEEKNKLKCTTKDTSKLLESEKMILNSIKTNSLDQKLYRKTIENETIKLKYVKLNKSGKFLKIIKMFATILLPILILFCSFKFDNYVFNEYEIYNLDNVDYLKIKDYETIEKVKKEVKKKDHYYHSNSTINGKEETFYSYSLIRMDKLQYGIVRFKIMLDILDALLIMISIIMIFVSIFMIIEQIIYFNKTYRRTIKGTELINKAYALKNFLKDFSLIKKRTDEELKLWEYYLIYSIILDINVKIKNKVTEDYLKKVIID